MGDKPILYGYMASPPCRAVLLVAKELGLELELKIIDMFAKEHLKPEYLKLNPQHTVPTLVDDGRTICDSHAIAIYFVEKYGKPDDSLYPNDVYVRAQINQRLYFEELIFSNVKTLLISFIHQGKWEVPKTAIDSAAEAYGYLETFLSDTKYLVGDQLTLADFSAIASVTHLNTFIPIDADKYPKLTQWIQRFNELPYFEDIHTKWLNQTIIMVEQARAKNKAAAEAK